MWINLQLKIVSIKWCWCFRPSLSPFLKLKYMCIRQQKSWKGLRPSGGEGLELRHLTSPVSVSKGHTWTNAKTSADSQLPCVFCTCMSWNNSPEAANKGLLVQMLRDTPQKLGPQTLSGGPRIAQQWAWCQCPKIVDWASGYLSSFILYIHLWITKHIMALVQLQCQCLY